MKSNRLSVSIHKPNSEIFSFYINPKNTPLWVTSIVKEKTNEWPIKVGTIYKNKNSQGVWSEYTVSDLKENELFELTSQDGNYHVRYTQKDLDNDESELEYYEWVDQGEIDGPFIQDTLIKLKNILEA